MDQGQDQKDVQSILPFCLFNQEIWVKKQIGPFPGATILPLSKQDLVTSFILHFPDSNLACQSFRDRNKGRARQVFNMAITNIVF